MRIATTTLFDRGLAAINDAQARLSVAQQQVSTGKRVNTAADDPVAATQILRTTSSLANNAQFISNQGSATDLLGLTDNTLGQVNDVLQSVRTTLVSANNSTLSDSDRTALAADLKSRLDTLVALGNTKDGDGHYLFSGYRSDTAPFANNGTSVTYAGDDGTRTIQVSPTRQLDVTANGADLFNRISQGNGVFTTAAGSGNTGGGIVDAGQVTDPTALTGHGYDIQFTVANGATSYQVIDTTTNTAVPAPATNGNAFTPGAAITVAGVQVTISGAPATGDHFTVAPAAKQSVFQTLQNAVALLSQPTTGAGSAARLSSGITASLANVDNAIDHALSARTSVGVRENELVALGTSSATADTDGQARLSKLQDTDYAQAAADLAKEQTALAAAQKVFATIGNKSLFDYL